MTMEVNANASRVDANSLVASVETQNAQTHANHALLSPQKQVPSTNFSLNERLNSPLKRNSHVMGAVGSMDEPRLVIERLVLINFKSYAGKQVIGPFHTSFSAVVGPNGSGKSNVIDSMLFVFGFRAAKMRQSKLKELIHNSEAFPDLEFCQVDIHFKKVVDHENSDGSVDSEVVPNSELIVSRKATNKNQSTYYLNNKASNYTEVTTMLKNEGIDLDHKRFLILQGEVEMISQMKPKAESENDDGLLEYLEDIIGTSYYKEPIEQLNAKVDVLQDELSIKESGFKYIDQNMNDHELQKDEALKYLEIEKEWKDKLQRYHYHTIKRAESDLVKNKEKLDEWNEKIGKDKDAVRNLEAKLEALSKEKETFLLKRKEMNKQYDLIKLKHKKSQQSKVQATEKIKVFKKKVDSTSKQLQKEGKSLKSSKSDLETINMDLDAFFSDLETLNKKLETENEILNSIKLELSSKTKVYSDEMEKLQKGLDPWKKKIDDADRKIKIKESEISMEQSELSNMSNEQASLSKDLTSKSNQIAINKAKIETLTNELNMIKSKFDENQSKYKDVEDQFKQNEIDINKLREKVSYAQSRISHAETQNKVLSALQNLKRTGRVGGFHGKLGDLGTIDDQYDVAVSTGGGSLGDFVVDTVEDAQVCIDYLRKNNIGFGKFIVLQKLRNFDMSRKNTPGNIPRLFDLIKPVSPIFAPAFYSSMYDTLVARNLNEANKAAFGQSKRWRVVTLDGKLVDTSGTMSGGGSRVSRGALKLASQKKTSHEFSQDEVDALVKELKEEESVFSHKDAAFKRMSQALRELSDKIPIKEGEIVRLTVECESLQNEIKEAKSRLKELENNAQRKAQLEKIIHNNERELSDLKLSKSKLFEQTSELESKIENLKNKIMDVGGLKLKKQTSMVNDLKDNVKLKNQKREKDELQAAKLTTNIEKLEKRILQLENDLKVTEKSRNETEETLLTFESDLEKIETELRELEFTKDEEENKSNEINEKIEQEREQLEEKNKEITDFIKGIGKFTILIQKNKEIIKQSKLQLREIDYRNVLNFITWIKEGDPMLARYYQGPIDYEQEANYEELDLKDLNDQCEKLKDNLFEMQVNLDVLPEYGKKLNEFLEKKNELEVSQHSLMDSQNNLKELNEKRLNEFKTGFEKISSTLKDMYFMITNGGVAELEFCDVHDPFQEGIAFSVMPPKKSWRNISNLSGGEKTLASLALVFALHHYKPTPLYVMDEIDAALDFKNVSIVANYIKSRTKNAQFIVISLRNNMFELSERLVGIYKTNNMTRSATLINKDLIN